MQRYPNDGQALELVRLTEAEIAIRAEYGSSHGNELVGTRAAGAG